MLRLLSFALLVVALGGGCGPEADAYTAKPVVHESKVEEQPHPKPVAEVVERAAANGPVQYIREPARAGISDLSKYDKNIATTPLTAAFSINQQLVFEASIPKALEIFEGTRNRKPNSHQEFMREIITKSNIRLPPLPPDYRYVYDPERGELMVEYPRPVD